MSRCGSLISDVWAAADRSLGADPAARCGALASAATGAKRIIQRFLNNGVGLRAA
jgi:hypothetical protein